MNHIDYGTDQWQAFVNEEIDFDTMVQNLREYAEDNVLG